MNPSNPFEEELKAFKAMLKKPIPRLYLEDPIAPIYFGCDRQAGHYAHMVGMRSARDDGNYHRYNQLDAAFAPQDTTEQGQAWNHCNQGMFNVISFWDRSVDKRPGSNSTFIIPGPKCFNDAIAEARALFPEVFRRFTFQVMLRRNIF